MQLLKFTDPKLRVKPSVFVFDETTSARDLANDLWNKCRQLKGLGLSANQVGIDARVFVMGVDQNNRKNVFNPKIISTSEETNIAKEGCLSYPGLWLNIKRPKSVVVSYQNETGETIVEELDGLPARIFQHEYDHMEGLNFSDHASELKMKMALKSLEKRAKKYVRKYLQHNL
jgi:peptide deformylase